MAVIAPHWCEYIWLEILNKPRSIQYELFPTVPAPEAALTAEREYVRATASSINSAEAAQLKRKAKGKATAYDPRQPKKLTIFTTEKFPAWQEKYIELVGEVWKGAGSIDDKELNGRIAKMGEMKKAMPFVQSLKKRLQSGEEPSVVLARKLAFDEQTTLLDMAPGLKRSAGFLTVEVILVEEGNKTGKNLTDGGKEVDVSDSPSEGATPGSPTFSFSNVEA